MKTKNDAAPQSSPLPWLAFDLSEVTTINAQNTGHRVALVGNPSDAALIVRRVNQGPAFDAMVEVATGVLESIDEHLVDGQSLGNTAEKLRAALKLAQESAK